MSNLVRLPSPQELKARSRAMRPPPDIGHSALVIVLPVIRIERYTGTRDIDAGKAIIDFAFTDEPLQLPADT